MSTRMPAAFIGHGSPMNALEDNRYTASWRALAQAVPERPRAVLVISAHWYIQATAVTAMPRPRTIHDFFGFPQQLFDVRYEPPGLPELAEEIRDVVEPTWIGDDVDSWGIDHGTWSVLTHLFPDADVPVVQLSVNSSQPLAYHLDLGTRLAALRDRGVLIIGSGNIVHNLGALDPRLGETGHAWAERFDDVVRETMLDRPGDLQRVQEHRDWDASVPIPDHFLPLAYVAGLAGAADVHTGVLVDGYLGGTISMTSYTVDVTVPTTAAGGGTTDALPTGAPVDSSNL